MNVVFFSRRRKTAEDEQWWTAMLKKAWKVKKFKIYVNSVFKQPSQLQTAMKWTLFSSLVVGRRPKMSNDELQCFSTTWTWKIGLKMRFKPPKTASALAGNKAEFSYLKSIKTLRNPCLESPFFFKDVFRPPGHEIRVKNAIWTGENGSALAGKKSGNYSLTVPKWVGAGYIEADLILIL